MLFVCTISIIVYVFNTIDITIIVTTSYALSILTWKNDLGQLPGYNYNNQNTSGS